MPQSAVFHAAPLLRHRSTGDFEEQATLLDGWNQDYQQISAGQFKGYLSDIHLPDAHLFMEFTSQSLYQSGCLADDVIAVGIPLSTSPGLFCGTRSQHGFLHVYSGSNGFEFISGQHALVGVIAVDREALLHTLSGEDAEAIRQRIARAGLLAISEESFDRLCHFFRVTFDLLRHKPQLIQSPAFSQILREAALDAVSDCLLDRMPSSDTILASRMWHTVTEVRDLLNRDDDIPLSVADLCRQLGMSRRNLQYHFESTLDMSPIEFLRAERLNGVRRTLRTANSVTEAAAHWGFWHFGHFSQDYKKMFGELPSVTFKRLHNS